MKKNVISLNEAQLRKMVMKSVKQIIREEHESFGGDDEYIDDYGEDEEECLLPWLRNGGDVKRNEFGTILDALNRLCETHSEYEDLYNRACDLCDEIQRLASIGR